MRERLQSDKPYPIGILPHDLRGDLDGEPLLLQEALDVSADAGIDGASQRDDLAVPEERKAPLEGPVDRGERRVQVLVDRGSDDEDEVSAVSDTVGLVLDAERPSLQGALEERLKRGAT